MKDDGERSIAKLRMKCVEIYSLVLRLTTVTHHRPLESGSSHRLQILACVPPNQAIRSGRANLPPSSKRPSQAADVAETGTRKLHSRDETS